MPARPTRARLVAALALTVLVSGCTSGTDRPVPVPTVTPVASASAPVASASAPAVGAAPPTVTAAPPPSADASAQAAQPELSRTTLNAVVDGQSVTASTTIASTPPVTADLAGVCARNATGGDVDFPFRTSVTVSTAGTAFTASRTLLPGTYTYWSCAKVDGRWTDIGEKQSVVIPAALAPASGQAMPVGDIDGWKQIFTDDFATDVPLGGFPGPYARKWSGYDGFPDTSGEGEYAQRILSVHDGVLDMYLHSENGTPLGAAPVPLINDGKWGGQVYGRYVIRFRSDDLPGYGTGWLLWPDNGDWNSGEIDFPEGSLSGHIQAFNHCLGNAHKKCMLGDTSSTYQGWHTATIEWLPDSLTFLLDGRVVAATTNNIPNTPMRWTLQTATNGNRPAPSTAGHLLIDWVAIYARA